jgi:hypothetical protein
MVNLPTAVRAPRGEPGDGQASAEACTQVPEEGRKAGGALAKARRCRSASLEHPQQPAVHQPKAGQHGGLDLGLGPILGLHGSTSISKTFAQLASLTGATLITDILSGLTYNGGNPLPPLVQAAVNTI